MTDRVKYEADTNLQDLPRHIRMSISMEAGGSITMNKQDWMRLARLIERAQEAESAANKIVVVEVDASMSRHMVILATAFCGLMAFVAIENAAQVLIEMILAALS